MADLRQQTERIWDELHLDIRRFILRRVGNDAAADDLLQQTFVRVLQGLPKLRDSDRVSGWVYRIARNVITDYYRKQGQEHRAVDSAFDEPADSPPDGESMNQLVGRWLTGLIDTLPAEYREAVRLVEIDGLLQREAADRLGLSLSGAKSRVQRGRAMLRQQLLDCCSLGFDRRGNLTECESHTPSGGCGCNAD